MFRQLTLGKINYKQQSQKSGRMPLIGFHTLRKQRQTDRQIDGEKEKEKDVDTNCEGKNPGVNYIHVMWKFVSFSRSWCVQQSDRMGFIRPSI
jgi:hypothetical protein